MGKAKFSAKYSDETLLGWTAVISLWLNDGSIKSCPADQRQLEATIKAYFPATRVLRSPSARFENRSSFNVHPELISRL